MFSVKVEEYDKAKRKRAEELLTRYNKLLRSKELKLVRSYWANSTKGIIDYARESGADVIVIGTKGLTGVEKFFMGSVASAVIDHAHCPVFAIR